ncbi:hypothetical protein [Granulicella tundricola]|uniref:Uncharacterized protein n=1 Tax=Granulicella tundricola (strain ATCC BAA-1859 / DSM 23138 / MP5ACTX9) TaxID=1198114 RepID=E8X5F8_GRATM|nr:hypothetical protein [Granulicella tundricola]ADW69505.1 hypothetical protein AciX9_2472 [Granulicella tundricola MP5ACTX9]
MPSLVPSRLLLALALPLAAAAQTPAPHPSTLPATPPTTPQPAPTPAYQPPAPPAASRATITWTAGQLSVVADNSSLNQILRDISRQTGLKITGGVQDERVYGTYGPAEPATVLATLLTGTGSNMLLRQPTGNAPQELVLTPRQGGPTPPSPASSHPDDADENAIVPPPRPQRPPMPFAPPPPTNIQSATQQQQNSGQQPPPDTSTSSDTGVRTPQQIYDQLMKLQQQKSTAPPQ